MRILKKQVLVYAPLSPQESGGVAQYVQGLAFGLRSLSSDDFHFTWVLRRGLTDWIHSHLDPKWRVVEVNPPTGYLQNPSVVSELPSFDLVHFPYQVGFLPAGKKPFVYQPHDLQHFHFPENFTVDELRRRDDINLLSRRATRLIVSSNFTAQDISARLGIDKNKIDVTSYGPPLMTEVENDGNRLTTPEEFALYPAASWPHKNHQNLFLAIRDLAGQGLAISVVLPGARSGSVDLGALADSLGIRHLVHLPGFVSESQLRDLYKRATLVVIPTLFESASFPIWEAMQLGIPIACSDVTSLPEQLGGAGLLFNPTDINDIANAIRRLWNDSTLRKLLVERGTEVIGDITWGKTSQNVVQTYKRALNLRMD